MTVCLSKGLGAPIGSLLFGSDAFIKTARRWRKVLGGGMRQAGILCAAAKIALEDNIGKLKTDHENAQYLAKQLNNINGFSVELKQVETNMVFVKIDKTVDIFSIANNLKAQKIMLTPSENMRLVTHLDINKDKIDRFISVLKTHL
jgi:threonine aldolase